MGKCFDIVLYFFDHYYYLMLEKHQDSAIKTFLSKCIGQSYYKVLILSVPKFTAYLYCIYLSIYLWYT